MGQEKIFRFAIMGAGGIAEKFCDAVNRLENMEVIAVASKSLDRASRFAKKNNVAQAYDSYEEMLKDADPDGVYIATTPNYHFELTMLCLDYKKPVLCEKSNDGKWRGSKTSIPKIQRAGSLCYGGDVVQIPSS